MPRANRHYLPGHIWHITHRCHKQEFLLKFARDKQRIRYWMFQAKKRYGLRILNFIITSNHIHLLLLDRGKGEIAKSMQLIAGRTAQEYNYRKKRKGAYWEDRYHATAVDCDKYLAECMTYIDLNMVRAGVVSHPKQWRWSGYHEIQNPPSRYKIIDETANIDLFGMDSFEKFQLTQKKWATEKLGTQQLDRESLWTESLAVGHREYVEGVKQKLKVSAKYRSIAVDNDVPTLKESAQTYSVHFGC